MCIKRCIYLFGCAGMVQFVVCERGMKIVMNRVCSRCYRHGDDSVSVKTLIEFGRFKNACTRATCNHTSVLVPEVAKGGEAGDGAALGMWSSSGPVNREVLTVQSA